MLKCCLVSSFIAHTYHNDLLHLYVHMERLGQFEVISCKQILCYRWTYEILKSYFETLKLHILVYYILNSSYKDF